MKRAICCAAAATRYALCRYALFFTRDFDVAHASRYIAVMLATCCCRHVDAAHCFQIRCRYSAYLRFICADLPPPFSSPGGFAIARYARVIDAGRLPRMRYALLPRPYTIRADDLLPDY